MLSCVAFDVLTPLSDVANLEPSVCFVGRSSDSIWCSSSPNQKPSNSLQVIITTTVF